MKTPVILLSLMVLGGAITGCSVKYGCPAPGGVQCKPVSEVYRSLGQTGKVSPKGSGLQTKAEFTAETPVPETPVPVRSAPKILRAWIAPWIDHDGDLHQEGYLYLVVDHGAWALGLPAVEPEPVPEPGMMPERSPLGAGDGMETWSEDHGK